MKLHLGCGDIRIDGWVGVDVRPGPAVDLVADIASVDNLPRGCEAVYACHVLEHFGFHGVQPAALDVLAGWVSLLKPGGTCYLSVPDLQRVGAAIAATDNLAVQFNFMKCLYGGCEYEQNRHFIGFTYQLLGHVMHLAGLVDMQTFESFADDTSRFVLHGCPVSLNLKGTRP